MDGRLQQREILGGWRYTAFTNTTESGLFILSAGPHVFNRSNFEIVINSVIEGSKDIKKFILTSKLSGRHNRLLDVLKISHLRLILAMITIMDHSTNVMCML